MMRILRAAAAMAVVVSMALPAYAQMGSQPGGNPVTLSQQRAGKSTAPKADEKAYKDALSHIPAADKKPDPWKSMR